MKRRDNRQSQTELAREVLRLLDLPQSREGLRKAHRITRTPEAKNTLTGN